MPPKIAGIDIPQFRLSQLSERQLQQMTPFERDVIRRLEAHDLTDLEFRAALEGLSKLFEEHKRESMALTIDKIEDDKKATKWAWIRTAVITPTVIVAIIGSVDKWAERTRKETLERIDMQATLKVNEKAAKIEERALIKAEDLAKAVLDEQERRERQRPLNRNPDSITPISERNVK